MTQSFGLHSSAIERNIGGFTLVEMLVAISLIGLLMVGLAGTLTLGVKVWSASSSANEEIDTVRSVQNTLRQMLGTAYPHWTGANPAHVDFSGNDIEMEFVSRSPMALQRPGFARYWLAAIQGNGTVSVVLKLQQDLAQTSGATAEEIVLLPRVKSIEFSYFGPGETSPTSSWQSKWRNRSELPHLIRIEVVGEDSPPLPWPELVIRPAIDVDISCDFDPLSRRCRGR